MPEYDSRFKKRTWKRRSVGDGSQGPRIYDWALEEIEELKQGFKRVLLFRRSVSDPKEIAYYFGYVKQKAIFTEIIRAAGSKWSIWLVPMNLAGVTSVTFQEVQTFIDRLDSKIFQNHCVYSYLHLKN